MTLFKGCHVVKCNESGEAAVGEAHIQYKVIELGNAQPGYEPGQTAPPPERILALLEKVR